MKKNIVTSAIVLGVMIISPLASFAQTDTEMMKKDTMMEGKDLMKKEGEKMTDKKMTKKEMMAKKKADMKKKAMEKKAMMQKKIMEKKNAMMKDKEMEKKDDAMMKVGIYTSVAPDIVMSKLSMIDKNVLFFHASWCPTCKSADASILKEGVRAGYNVIKVDYDTSTELKKKYGVTTQHTFVQVDKNGEIITSWRGGEASEIYTKSK